MTALVLFDSRFGVRDRAMSTLTPSSLRRVLRPARALAAGGHWPLWHDLKRRSRSIPDSFRHRPIGTLVHLHNETVQVSECNGTNQAEQAVAVEETCKCGNRM
jgi:hypothetical protein